MCSLHSIRESVDSLYVGMAVFMGYYNSTCIKNVRVFTYICTAKEVELITCNWNHAKKALNPQVTHIDVATYNEHPVKKVIKMVKELEIRNGSIKRTV